MHIKDRPPYLTSQIKKGCNLTINETLKHCPEIHFWAMFHFFKPKNEVRKKPTRTNRLPPFSVNYEAMTNYDVSDTADRSTTARLSMYIRKHRETIFQPLPALNSADNVDW